MAVVALIPLFIAAVILSLALNEIIAALGWPEAGKDEQVSKPARRLLVKYP